MVNECRLWARAAGYHWDDYDMRGSRTLVGCGGEGAVAATPDLLLLAEDAAIAPPSPPDDGSMEGLPLLAGEFRVFTRSSPGTGICHTMAPGW